MMMTYLGASPEKAQHELNDSRGCHARISFLVDLFEYHLAVVVEANGNDVRIEYHITRASRSYLLVLADKVLFCEQKCDLYRCYLP